MANNHLNNSAKLRIYNNVYRLNRAFETVIHSCRELDDTDIFKDHHMLFHRGKVRELQSRISHDVVDVMHDFEDRNSWRFENSRKQESCEKNVSHKPLK